MSDGTSAQPGQVHGVALKKLGRRAILASAGAAIGSPLLPAAAHADADATWATNLSAVEASAYIRHGDMDAERYVGALLNQANRVHALDIFISGNAEALLDAARTIDVRRRRGSSLGPMAGVPLIVKDNIDTVAFPTTAGTPALVNNRPATDAPALSALFRADALLFGKANMHELAFGVTSDNATYGAVHNPYAFNRIPGGSSGGTAAGIAARVSPAGLGTDTGGSVRIPASLSGVVGFRPSTGRYAQGGTVPFSHTRDTIGPMARHVGDVAVLDAVMANQSVPRPRKLHGLRLGLPSAYFWSNLDPETEAVANSVIVRLQHAGVVVVEVDLPGLQTLLDGIAPILPYEAIADLRIYLAHSNTGLSIENLVARIASPDVKQGYEFFLNSPPSYASYLAAINNYRPMLQALYADCFRRNGIEALCFPPLPTTAPLIGQADLRLGGIDTPVMSAYFHNENPGSASGQPGLVLPAGLSRSGLPVGFELDGPIGSDANLLAIGMACQAVLPPIPGPLL